MSTSSVTPVPSTCPACSRRGTPMMLRAGAAIDGLGCAQCGGVLLTSIGSERLLHEELALSRSTLLEIAQGFGGHRFNCPSCTSKMRPLLLRGVDVDLCFHCGALWLDDGEIERLSASRYRSTPRTVVATTTTTTLAQPDAALRFSAVHPFRRLLGELCGFFAVAAGVIHLLGIGNDRALGAMIALSVAWAVNRSRRVVDVFPRARRLLRSRKLLPAGPRDEGAEHLDDVRFVVARPSWLGVETALVDSVGRTLVVIEVKSGRGALAGVEEHARRLGAQALIHPALADATKAAALPAATTTTTAFPLAPSLEHTVTVLPIATRGPHLQVDGVRNNRAVWTLRNAVPARGDERNRFDLGFFISGLDGAVLARFHDDGRGTTVVVGADGEALASIRRRRLGRVLLHEIARARSPRRLRLLPVGFGRTLIVDDELVRHATIGDHRLRVRQTGDDEGLLCLLLFAHVLIDDIDRLRGP